MVKMYKITCACGYVALVTPVAVAVAMTELTQAGYIIVDFGDYIE